MTDESRPRSGGSKHLPHHTVRGAVYRDLQSGERVRLLRLAGRRVLVENIFAEASEPFYLETIDFADRFELTDDHDHENYCCLLHGIHVNPHRGCILR